MKLEDLNQEKLDELLSQVESLAEANKGLKSDLFKAKNKAKGADIDPEVHAALQAQVEELTGKLEKTQKQLKADTEKLTASLQEKDGALTKHLIEAQLTEHISKVGVKPEFIEAARALLRTSAAIKVENGEYRAMINDKPLPDAVKEWATGDQGKHFVAAPASSGGGAQGGGDRTAGKTKTRAEFDAMSHPERAAFSKDGGKVVD